MATASFASVFGIPRFRAWNQAGTTPLVGGIASFFVGGSATPLSVYPTYNDALAGTNALGTTVVLDANGEATIFVQTAALVKVVLTDILLATQWTIDNIPVANDVPRSLTSVIKNGNMTGFAGATKVATWTVECDALGEWSAGNNRWVALYPGKFIFLASAEMTDTTINSVLTLAIHKNGSQVGRTANRSSATASQIWGYHAHYAATNIIAGDFFEVFVTGTANTTISGSVGSRFTVQGVA